MSIRGYPNLQYAPNTISLLPLWHHNVERRRASGDDDMNAVAERYAHLVLALGQHDPDYVDAFYGPAEWKTQAEKEKKSLDAIGAEAAELSAMRTLAKTSDAAKSGDEMLKLRREYLQKQVSALAARVRMLKGEKLKFDDESRALYDAVAPTYRQSGSDGFAFRSDHCANWRQRFRARVRCGSATRNGGSRL